MKNCKLISTAVAAMLLGSSAYAGGIDSFLGDAVQTQSTGGGTVSTSKGTMLYGGSFQMRAKTVNIHPISVTAPHIKAGCGGIDMGLGSLSFLDMDQIVSLLQGMMANAPGVMFEMGLKVICPSCMDTLNALEQLANQINGMNLNSCSIDKAAANWAEGAIGESVSSGVAKDFNKGAKDWAGKIGNFSDKVGLVSNWLKGEGCLPGDSSCGAKFFMTSSSSLGTQSFMEYAFKQDISDAYWSNDNVFINAMRQLAGDILKVDGSGSNADQNDGMIMIVHSDYPLDIFNKEKVNAQQRAILGLLVGDDNTINDSVFLTDSRGNQITQSSNSTIKAHFKHSLEVIALKIGSRSPLNSADITFLGMFQMPVYLMINKLAQIQGGDTILTSLIDELSTMMAYEILYEYISRTSNVLSKEQSKMTPDILEKIPFKCGTEGCYSKVTNELISMRKGLRNAAMQAYSLSADASSEVARLLGENSKTLQAINDLERFSLMRSDPDMFNKLMFAKGMTGSGK